MTQPAKIQLQLSPSVADLIVKSLTHCLMEIEKQLPNAVDFVFTEYPNNGWTLLISYFDTWKFVVDCNSPKTKITIYQVSDAFITSKMVLPRNGSVDMDFSVQPGTHPEWDDRIFTAPFIALCHYFDSINVVNGPSSYDSLGFTSDECVLVLRRILNLVANGVTNTMEAIRQKEIVRLEQKRVDDQHMYATQQYLREWFPPPPKTTTTDDQPTTTPGDENV